NRVLNEKGFNYYAEVCLNRENFPERTYGELKLGAGEYDALIVNLGTGEGDNWWCVAFPPLCFIPAEDNGTDKIEYKSKVAEWLDKIMN
ncbi:MAG: stage II sporulation protein R, partial [Clostridia bacterium]|nr:stage II sporulation protein R [Clostridia bacterium]